MERQLLTIFFIVISVFGCQQTPTITKDIPNEISINTSYELVEKKDSVSLEEENLISSVS